MCLFFHLSNYPFMFYQQIYSSKWISLFSQSLNLPPVLPVAAADNGWPLNSSKALIAEEADWLEGGDPSYSIHSLFGLLPDWKMRDGSLAVQDRTTKECHF